MLRIVSQAGDPHPLVSTHTGLASMLDEIPLLYLSLLLLLSCAFLN